MTRIGTSDLVAELNGYGIYQPEAVDRFVELYLTGTERDQLEPGAAGDELAEFGTFAGEGDAFRRGDQRNRRLRHRMVHGVLSLWQRGARNERGASARPLRMASCLGRCHHNSGSNGFKRAFDFG